MLVHQETRSLVLQAKDPFHLRTIIPSQSRILNHPDYNLAVKHTMATTRTLRNLGFDVPSPIAYQYSWPGKHKPFDHQRVMADFLTLYDKAFNLSEMGTGKTYAALWAADYLMTLGVVKRVLVLTTRSTMDTVWKQDIFDLLMHRRCAVVHGTMTHRLNMLNSEQDFYVLNHDGVKLPAVAKEIRRRTDIDLVIVDEIGMFRNGRTDNYKFLEWIMEKKTKLWCMSGTPCPNEPTDAWSIAKLVDPSRVPRWFGTFQRQTMMKISEHKWAPKKGAKELAYAAMKPAVRFLKKDCLTLPPVVTLNRQTRLSKAQSIAFAEMRNTMILEKAQGVITAVNAADKINKLRQILCGSVKDAATDSYVHLDHRFRYDDLVSTIDEASAKSIVIVPFKGIIQSLAQQMVKDGYTVGVINGDVSQTKRDRIINQFKHEAHPQTLLCHPRVMAHGLNLTAADMTIFYAPIYSSDEYEQVIERFNRSGQTRKMTIVRFAAHPLEWEIYRMVDGRRINQKAMLDLFDTITHH